MSSEAALNHRSCSDHPAFLVSVPPLYPIDDPVILHPQDFQFRAGHGDINVAQITNHINATLDALIQAWERVADSSFIGLRCYPGFP